MNATLNAKTVETAPDADAKLGLEMYERMLLIRLFEQKAGEVCRKGEISSFLHLYIGEEATAVGVCDCLTAADYITSTHRGHGHALAKGSSPARLMAELYGRVDGVSGGRGGSMHMYDSSVGLLGTNGFVAAGIPTAVGAALSARNKRTGAVAVSFFGDGAVSHGAFHEAVNLATALQLPVVFVCENNLYATHTPLTTATRNTEIATRGAAYGLPGVTVDGQDAFAVRAVAMAAVERARSGGGPTLIEAKTYRFVGHHEGDPPAGTYRTADEVERWKQRDPLTVMRSRLEERGVNGDTLEGIRVRVAGIIDDAVAFSRANAWPSRDTLTDHLYCEAL
jgi:2-oxoisovalerate dehydrogenase E1 component